jgi:serpin B
MKHDIVMVAVYLLLQSFAFAAAAQAPSDSDRASVVDGNNAFAVALYAQLRSGTGNLFFSPESISTALAMTYAGARGQTAAEMEKALHFMLPPERLSPAAGALLNRLNAAHAGYQLSVANGLWAQQDLKFLPAFLELTERDFGAGVNRVDFDNAAEAAKRINDWVEQKTEDKIRNLITPGALGSDTKLVLANAIYFKGNWETPFSKARTEQEDFYLSGKQKVTAPLMHRGGSFNYFDGGTFQALEIPYKTGELSMIVLLPNKTDGLSRLEQAITPSSARQWLSQLRRVPSVLLTLPRFTMTQQFQLSGTLAQMGMPLAFDKEKADFTGMTEGRGLFISAVIHKAFVDVNEQGTEAAAATGVLMQPAMAMARPQPPPIVFRADHPFVFLIRENRSGAILFMGRVTDPTK